MSTRTVQVPAVPTVTIFVRHSATCPNRENEFYKNCRCPKHLRYSAGGQQHRQSARTRIWKLAEDVRRKIEAQYAAADPTKPIETVTVESDSRKTIEQAAKLFQSSKKSQVITSDVLKKYERELERFGEFMAKRSKHFPHEITVEDLTIYRATWETLYPSSTTRSKVQERLRGFLRYCYDSKMMDRVPPLSAIKVDEPPTEPLSDEQYKKLLEVIPGEFTPMKATRVRALVQLMRYSGLAIRDAVTLERDELQRDARNGPYRIVTDRQKTGTPVSVVIAPDIAAEIEAAMKLNANPRYAFWNTGTGKPQTAVTNWQHDLRQVFRAAGQPEGHPHQLRDTFAVNLLQRGVPLEEVSKLLGHTSIKTTEKHYARWVKARQERLDTLVMGTF